MSRKHEIDSFLRYYASVYESNPNFEINADTFYYSLMTYGISEEELNSPMINDKFDSWIKRYYGSSHLNVHHSQYQEKFLQFPSRNHSYGNEFKLYLSFPKDKMEKCVNDIFDFIERNKIDSGSKVADRVRSDSVVLRLSNSMDVAKVLDYVNRNEELYSNARSTNPFLMRYGVCGFAYDDRISYNTVVTIVLESYFKQKRQEGKLSEVSYQDFTNYALEYHNSLFSDARKLDEFTRHKNFKSVNHQNLGYALTNYEQVIRLMCSSLMGDFTFEQYRDYVNECNNVENNREYAAYYGEFIKSAYPFSNNNGFGEQKNSLQDRNLASAQTLLDEYITYAIDKYGKEGVSPYLHHFMRGHIEGITKDKGFRMKFSQILDGPLINQITNGDIDGYIRRFHTNKQSIESFDIVYQACVETYKKYGYGQLYGAIEKGISGNYASFTNGLNKLRDKLYTSVTPEEFKRICEEIAKRHGYNTQFNEKGYLHCADAISAQISRTQEIANSQSITL